MQMIFKRKTCIKQMAFAIDLCRSLYITLKLKLLKSLILPSRPSSHLSLPILHTEVLL